MPSIPIKRLQKGKAPTLLSAKKGNEVIDALNALRLISVTPSVLGSFKVTDKNAALDLTPLANLLSGMLGVPLGASNLNPPNQANSIAGLAARLANPHATATCVGGVITITITI